MGSPGAVGVRVRDAAGSAAAVSAAGVVGVGAAGAAAVCRSTHSRRRLSDTDHLLARRRSGIASARATARSSGGRGADGGADSARRGAARHSSFVNRFRRTMIGVSVVSWPAGTAARWIGGQRAIEHRACRRRRFSCCTRSIRRALGRRRRPTGIERGRRGVVKRKNGRGATEMGPRPYLELLCTYWQVTGRR